MRFSGQAGVLLEFPHFEQVPPEQWRAMIRTSLEGAYLTIQAVVPAMRVQGWGRIVNISSSLAEDGLPGAGAYAAAKAGLHGLTRSLARELGPVGILTNVVMPGMTLTEQARRELPPAILDQVARETPTGCLTTPDEMAALVVFLGSATNGHINGEIIRVTGGL
jgi:NAD(P)-dependent dehydrogenase (short-subunit alcohol dehydrogenase family)